jgi:hypothetical protein
LTDVRKSNSAAMYLALASFVANEDNIVQSEAEVNAVMPLMESLFLKQGYVEYSLAVPFKDYLVMGMGKALLVMIYEAQFIYQAAMPDSGLGPEMVLMYPELTVVSSKKNFKRQICGLMRLHDRHQLDKGALSLC